MIKREFPDWYKQRLDEAIALACRLRTTRPLASHVARKLVELRRQHAVSDALRVSLPRT